MNLLTKIFKRPLQVVSIILMGLCMHVLLPKDPSAEQRATTYLLSKYGTAELNGYINQLNAEGKT